MSVISSITNGKKDSKALAATEKAKVCTSVRNKYRIVEKTSPEYRWGRFPFRIGWLREALAGVIVVGSGTAFFLWYQTDGDREP